MKPEAAIIDEARDALLSCLGETLVGDLEESPTRLSEVGSLPDISFRLTLADTRTVDMIVEVKNSGQPRYARAAVDHLRVWTHRRQATYGIFIAPYITPSTGEICARAGVGYVDLAGNCRIEIDQSPTYIYIRKETAGNPRSENRALRSLYSPKASRALRALLAYPQRRWRVLELSREAGISLGQTSKVKSLLADREWTSEAGAGFALRNPETVLVEWAGNLRYSDKRVVHDYYSFDKPGEFEKRLVDFCESEGVRYGLAEFSGAARMAPFVRYQRATVYVARDADKIAEKLQLKPVQSGANVRLMVPSDDGVFLYASRIGGAQVVSPVQLYLDLRRVPGRGDEAANAILEQVLRPVWGGPVIDKAAEV